MDPGVGFSEIQTKRDSLLCLACVLKYMHMTCTCIWRTMEGLLLGFERKGIRGFGHVHVASLEGPRRAAWSRD